jgi:hypothetical protein
MRANQGPPNEGPKPEAWASRFRSGNFVWRHVLHMGLSTGCRLPVVQAVAAAAVRCFGPTTGSFCVLYAWNQSHTSQLHPD